MKPRLSSKLLAFCTCILCSTTLWAQYTEPVRTMSIPATVDAIVFDGIDNESSYSEAQTMNIYRSEGYTGENDFSGYFKVCWDERFLYLFADITDDVDHSFPNSNAYDTWMYDNIEFYLDLDTSGSETYYTDHTVQVRYNRGWNRVMWSGRADAGDFFCYLHNKPDSSGWVLETAIPWTCVLPTGSLPKDINEYIENSMGFDVCFSDSDGDDPFTGMRDVMTAWDSDDPDDPSDRTEDNAWNNRKVFGIVEFLGDPLPAPTEIPPTPVDPPEVIAPPITPDPPPAEIVNYVEPIQTMNIPATVDAITFDGLDNEASYNAAQALHSFYDYSDGGDADFSGYFKVSWDSTYLYFFAKITDDIEQSNLYGGNDWEFDNVEVLLDLDTTSDGTWYDENTAQMRFNRGWECVSWTGRATADDFYYYSGNTPENDGWVVETAIPWICALPAGSLPEDIFDYINNSIGFEVMGTDSDGDDPFVGTRDSQSAWDMDDPDTGGDRTEDNAWNNTRVFGIVQLLGNPIASPPSPPAAGEPPVASQPPAPPSTNPPGTGENFITPIRSMYILQTTDSMLMDGIPDEASYSPAQEMYVFNGTGLDDNANDFDGTFRVCWDYQYLYFFADITDDVDHSVLEDNNAWMFDNIEVYLDLSIDSLLYSYDDNSIQIRFNRGLDYVTWPGRAAREEYIYHWENKADNTGWIVETAIPWTAALPEGKVSEDIAVYIQNNIGFDVIFSDSDGDDPQFGMRDTGIAWDMDDPDTPDDRTEDNAWNNTHVFGVVNLQSDQTLPEYRAGIHLVNIETNQDSDNIKAYPNPSGGIIYFENLSNVAYIEISTLLGQVLQRIDVTDPVQEIDLTGSNAKGLLIIRYITKNRSTSTEKLILK